MSLYEWRPSTGVWNPKFSDHNRAYCTNLFFFFKDVKKLNTSISENMALMLTYKNIYPSMKYSQDQEEYLHAILYGY